MPKALATVERGNWRAGSTSGCVSAGENRIDPHAKELLMFTRVARFLTVVALGLAASLTVAAHAAASIPDAADTGSWGVLPVLPRVWASGIRGTVVLRTGDLMPPLDPKRAKIVPVSVPLYVFQGNTCVATIRSDKDGEFQLVLPAGRYLIVVQVSGADVVTRAVQVQEDQWTELVIHFDMGVTF
jgi:hypothetical protein